jgi:hypothetical protein
MTDTTDHTDATREELAAALVVRTTLAEAAADDANRERDTALAHTERATDAKRRGAQLEAADHASAADNAASRARRAATAAVEHQERAWQLQLALDPERVDQAADSDEPLTPAGRALAARHEAERAAHGACSGIDWLRYHLDGHCQGWRERIGDGATSTAA